MKFYHVNEHGILEATPVDLMEMLSAIMLYLSQKHPKMTMNQMGALILPTSKKQGTIEVVYEGEEAPKSETLKIGGEKPYALPRPSHDEEDFDFDELPKLKTPWKGLMMQRNVGATIKVSVRDPKEPHVVIQSIQRFSPNHHVLTGPGEDFPLPPPQAPWLAAIQQWLLNGERGQSSENLAIFALQFALVQFKDPSLFKHFSGMLPENQLTPMRHSEVPQQTPSDWSDVRRCLQLWSLLKQSNIPEQPFLMFVQDVAPNWAELAKTGVLNAGLQLLEEKPEIQNQRAAYVQQHLPSERSKSSLKPR